MINIADHRGPFHAQTMTPAPAKDLKVGVGFLSKLTVGVPFLIALSALLWKAPGLEFYLNSADHGYQLSLGHQILKGRIPFVDLFFHYGPLTAYTSALGLWLWESLIPETCICATGYALAIALIYWILRPLAGRLPASITAITAFLLLARFYKWYYWFFPLMALAGTQRLMNSPAGRPTFWLATSGLLDGVAALYRFDLGLACTCFHCLAIVALVDFSSRPRFALRSLGIFLSANAIPIVAWLTVLMLIGGTSSIRDYAAATFSGAMGAVEGMSLPFPHFDWSDPTSRESRAAIAFLLVPVTSFGAVCVGLLGSRYARQMDRGAWSMCCASGLMGLGVLPQALHRADLGHLLQTIPPVLIAACVMVILAWRCASLLFGKPIFRIVVSILIGFYVVLATVSAGRLMQDASQDLAPWPSSPANRYEGLARGLDHHSHDPVACLVNELQSKTKAIDMVLVAGNAPQVYFFANRVMGGLLNCYVPGVLANREWRDRDLQAIRKTPPALVVVPPRPFTLADSAGFKQSRPELFVFVKKYYTQVVYDENGWSLLAPRSQPTDYLR